MSRGMRVGLVIAALPIVLQGCRNEASLTRSTAKNNKITANIDCGSGTQPTINVAFTAVDEEDGDKVKQAWSVNVKKSGQNVIFDNPGGTVREFTLLAKLGVFPLSPVGGGPKQFVWRIDGNAGTAFSYSIKAVCSSGTTLIIDPEMMIVP